MLQTKPLMIFTILCIFVYNVFTKHFIYQMLNMFIPNFIRTFNLVSRLHQHIWKPKIYFLNKKYHDKVFKIIKAIHILTKLLTFVDI